MTMKKSFLAMVALLVSAPLFFTSCNDDNGPSFHYEVVSDGAFIVNSGNMYSSIDGSLTGINYASNVAVQKVFALTTADRASAQPPMTDWCMATKCM